MDELTTTTIVRDALEELLNELRDYADLHDGQIPVASDVYFKACAALRLLEEEPDGSR